MILNLRVKTQLLKKKKRYIISSFFFSIRQINCFILYRRPLGQGAFGEVFQGVYRYRRNQEQPVAVKAIPSSSRPQTEADFMMEALIMSKFNHPNIVHFIGVSFERNPKYIVLELLAGGNLKNFLREERPRAVNSVFFQILNRL